MKKSLLILVSNLGFLASLTLPVLALDVTVPKPNVPTTNVGTIISAGVGATIVFSMLLVLVYLIWGGVQWLTSGGDKGATEAARNRITSALIGMVIIAGSWAFMKLIETFFNVKILSGFDIPTIKE